MTVDQSLKLEVHHLFLQGLVRWQAGRQAGRQTDRHNTDRLTGYIANQFLSFSSQYDDESSTSAPPLPIKVKSYPAHTLNISCVLFSSRVLKFQCKDNPYHFPNNLTDRRKRLAVPPLPQYHQNHLSELMALKSAPL
jgi:hypothetical protein